MKLRRGGVDIPSVPLLNWNLIARGPAALHYIARIDANHTTDARVA